MRGHYDVWALSMLRGHKATSQKKPGNMEDLVRATGYGISFVSSIRTFHWGTDEL